MNPTRRRFLAGLSVLAVAPVLAACGSGSDSTATPSSGGSSGGGTSEEAAFPATITHKFGETTVEAAPTRVVCVGLTEQDALMALGIVPVGVTYWFGDKELQGVYPWAQDKLGDAALPTVLDSTNGIDIEQVAALAPDLIIGQYAGITGKEYELLSKIAPTVAQSGDYADYGMPWDEMALNIATAVGRPEAMRAIIDGVNGQVAQAAADHPEFQGQTAAVVTPYEGLFLYGPEDPRSRMLQDLGFDLHPLITDADDSEFGVSLSSERTADLGDIGVAVWLDLAADQQVEQIFDKTKAHDEGRWVDISDADGSYYVAHSFVTPLSIPYLLERYVPQLAAAADGDPKTEPPVVTG
ncbi:MULTISPECIES: ABC transporter substrate-binding protein [unclassified Nocardioides]|uniref:ABC transporter substrate-binding protein n=1 Tax=unclassified Nocardioides TaxID=2615069 RepID=UPI0009F0532B|nr:MULTISPECIES: ABC transporter substrate-binding protein [unclassified Nocardioides]GAW51271.1 Putative ABC transporter substrate-binding protein [Nocardioides sp. PD653-B2]GAW52618.1 putative ABC transporter substrate-binding protein [Nocardioides sp. PD653]